MTGTLEPRSLSIFEPSDVAMMPTSREGFGIERLDEVSSNNQSELLETNTQFNHPKSEPSLTSLTKERELAPPLINGEKLAPPLNNGKELAPPLINGKELEPLLNKGGELQTSLNKGGEKDLQNPTSLDLLQQLPNLRDPAPLTPQPTIPITSDPNIETRKFPSLPPPVQLPSVPTQLVLSQPSIGEERQIFGSSSEELAKVNHDFSSDVAASMLHPSGISATPSSSVTEPHSIPQHQLTIQQVFQQVTSAQTLLNPESLPIQTTVLSPSAPDSFPRKTPQQTYPEQPTLTTPVTSEKSEVWQHQSTSESEHKPSILPSIDQRIITEQIIVPVKPSTSTRGEIESADHLSKMGGNASPQLLVVGRSLSNQNNNQKIITNNSFPARRAVQPTTNDQQPIPTIQVNIGRIEVRATPPAVTPNHKQRSVPPVMNLDEYLGQRSKGGNR